MTTVTSETLADHSITVDFFSDYSKHLTAFLITFCVFAGLGLLLAGCKFYAYTARNPSAQFNDDYRTIYSRKFLYYLLDVEGELMFWMIFLTTGILLLSFKTQNAAVLLLPELGEVADGLNSAFNAVIGMCLAFKTISVVLRIIEQAKVDVYIIDYERPHNQTRQVSGWRRLFVANEWNELG